MELFNREEHLKNQLNMFLTNDLGLPENDYYSNLHLNDFLKLKSILNNINNIFTLKVSLSFTQWISNILELNTQERDLITHKIISTKPNANGFDIEILEPINLIAEIKCNIPINQGTIYGSAQRNGIKKDISALLNGKTKSSINPNTFIKFIVFLDKPEIRQATIHFINNHENKSLFIFADNNTKFNSTKCIYIVFVEI